jgi:hypothetical protein
LGTKAEEDTPASDSGKGSEKQDLETEYYDKLTLDEDDDSNLLLGVTDGSVHSAFLGEHSHVHPKSISYETYPTVMRFSYDDNDPMGE